MPLLKCTDTEITYGRKPSDRLNGAIVGAVMLALTTVLLVMVGSTLPRSGGHSPLELMQPIAFGGIFEMIGLSLFIFFQFTEDIIMDLTTRTYRFRSGLPPLARWRTGPLTDIQDIVLREVATKQGKAYRLAFIIRQRQPGLLRATLWDWRDVVVDNLDNSGQRARSEVVAEMEIVAHSLALPAITGHDEDPDQVRKRSFRLTALCTIVAMALSCALFGPPAALAIQLDRQGLRTTGEVMNMRRGSKTTVMEYRYETNGRTHVSHENVTADTFSRTQIGDYVAVTYLPDYQDTCRTVYSVDTTIQEVGTFVLAAGGSLGFGICYALYRSRRKPSGTSHQYIGHG